MSIWILQESIKKAKERLYKKTLAPSYPGTKTNPANGFLPGRNILTNANIHKNSSIIVTFDLKDAFTSTKEDMLLSALEDYFTKKGSRIIVRLCCLDGHLPQGAPTSPMLLNYALLKMDKKLSSLTKNIGWRYSRYADDLTFSCESHNSAMLGVGTLIKKINIIVNDCGYRINKKKMRVCKPNRTMKVTGLVLNSGEPTISRKVRRIIRAKVHNFVSKGIGQLSEISGYVSYISLIHKNYADRLKSRIRDYISTCQPTPVTLNK